MAKKILLSNNLGSNIPVANSGLKLSKNILIEKVEPHDEFQKLFKINDLLKDRIANNMGDDGFDPSQPIHIWKMTDDEGTEHYYLIDGYTRVAAAKQAKLVSIPYYEHNFETFEEAYRYVISLQVNRRNLDSNTLLDYLRVLMGTDYIKNYEGTKSVAIAEELGIGKRTVEKAMSVEKSATPEQKQRIEKGEATIAQIYKENHPKKEPKKAVNTAITSEIDTSNDNSLDTDLEALSDNSGTPSSLNFSHTDGVERPNFEPTSETEIDSWNIEKNKQVETARKEGFAKGFETALIFVLAEIKKGRTPEEVYNDERLTDLSPSQIYDFVLPSEDEEIVGEM